MQLLRRVAAQKQCKWIPGRQGSGYEKVVCQMRSPTTYNPTTGDLADSHIVSEEVYRSLCLITRTEPIARLLLDDRIDETIRSLPSCSGSDSYFLRCGPGISIPPHTDPARPGFEHHRLNVVLSTDHVGGDVSVDGHRVEWQAGDALIFRPDLLQHEVSTVTSGQRLLWSVGCTIPVSETAAAAAR